MKTPLSPLPAAVSARPPLRAFTSELTAADAPLMYAPGGEHVAVMGYGPAVAEVALRITPETAQVLQASLEAALRAHAPQRPFLDKNHEPGDGATGWPSEFFWSDSPQPGVYLRAELSDLGRAMIQGKIMRAFSPSFHSDADLPAKPVKGQVIRIPAGKRGSKENPARMTGINFPDAGTLTNDPAFRKILPLWAKNAAGAPSSESPKPAPVGAAQHRNIHMTPEEKAALQARKTELEQNLPTLRAKAEADPEANKPALEAAEAELESASLKLDAEALRAKNAALEEAVLSQRNKDAADAVKAAVKRGAIPPKDEALQAKWQKRCVEDPENLELLASMKGSPALEGPRRLVLSSPQITREDTVDVLRAYAAEPNARLRGMLYRKELSERVAKGEPMCFDKVPLKGVSNALGTVVSGIVTQRTLELVFTKFPLLGAVTTDFSDQPAKYNETITTRTIGLPTVQNLGGTISNAAVSDVPVTLSLLKEAAFQFAATEWGGTNRNLVQEHSQAMSVALGRYLTDSLAALWDDTYTAETVKAVAAIDYSTITGMVRDMNIAGVPDFGRWGCVNSYVAEAFRNDELIMEHFVRDQGSGYATWRNLEGFENIFEYPALPANSVNAIAMFGSKSACVAACRLLTDPATLTGLGYPGTLQAVVEPLSGLSVLANNYVDANTLAITTRLILLGGVDEGQIACGHKWVSS